jgi:endoglucanase
MHNLSKLLTELINAPGIPGHEERARAVTENAWRPLTDELEIDRLGGLRGLKSGSGKEPRKRILIEAHMDAIGFMVREVKGEFLHLSAVGGADARVLPGQFVTVHGREDIPGLIASPAMHALPEAAQKGTIPLEHLLVDTGLPPKKLAQVVRAGDLISFATAPEAFDGDILTGPALDNRAGVAALTGCLELLQKRAHGWDVLAIAASREELQYGASAQTSAFSLEPDLAIAVDTTFAKGPGYSGYQAFEMNGGPALGWGPTSHQKLFKMVESIAKEMEIPAQTEFLSGLSSTDADVIQTAASGVPILLLSVPIRYMHTPVEMAHLKDIQRTSQLLAEVITRLDDGFLKSLRWETDS